MSRSSHSNFAQLSKRVAAAGGALVLTTVTLIGLKCLWAVNHEEARRALESNTDDKARPLAHGGIWVSKHQESRTHDPPLASRDLDAVHDDPGWQDYLGLLQKRIESSWRPPHAAGSSTTGLCQIDLTQDRSGQVIDVSFTRCRTDIATQNSILAAIRDASPFPPPANPNLFRGRIQLSVSLTP
jgi:hypothetical protein